MDTDSLKYGVFSFIIPGLGQYINGDRQWALGLFAGAILIHIFIWFFMNNAANGYSFAGFALVKTIADTITATRIMISTIISNGCAVLSILTNPFAHINIKKHGSTYLITSFHVLPTLMIDSPLRAGRNLSSP